MTDFHAIRQRAIQLYHEVLGCCPEHQNVHAPVLLLGGGIDRLQRVLAGRDPGLLPACGAGRLHLLDDPAGDPLVDRAC